MVEKPKERLENQALPVFHLESLPALDQKARVPCGKEITGEPSSMSQTSPCFAWASCFIISLKLFVKLALEKNH